MESLYASTSLPGIEGIQVFANTRDPWSFDEAVNYLKHGLCQIEIDRQRAITSKYDSAQEVPKGAMPDVWSPLKELTENLLPHLRFDGIDMVNRDNVRCNWIVHRKDTVVDLDDLSSGEKSIIQMFYPLIEHRIRSLLRGATEAPQLDPICVLIDEPELHLHPNLQAKVLDHLRLLVADEGAQVILTTHSPHIVDYASYDELLS